MCKIQNHYKQSGKADGSGSWSVDTNHRKYKTKNSDEYDCCECGTDSKTRQQGSDEDYQVTYQHGIFPMQNRAGIINDCDAHRTERHSDSDIFLVEVSADYRGQCETKCY